MKIRTTLLNLDPFSVNFLNLYLNIFYLSSHTSYIDISPKNGLKSRKLPKCLEIVRQLNIYKRIPKLNGKNERKRKEKKKSDFRPFLVKSDKFSKHLYEFECNLKYPIISDWKFVGEFITTQMEDIYVFRFRKWAQSKHKNS